LGCLCVGGLLDLVWSSLGEGDGEKADEIVVSGLDSDVSLNESLPFSDQRAELVGGEVESVEVGQAVLALDLVDSQLDLAEGVILVLLEVGKGDFQDTTLQGIIGVLETGGTVDQGLPNTAMIPSRQLLHPIPIPRFHLQAYSLVTGNREALLSDGEGGGSL